MLGLVLILRVITQILQINIALLIIPLGHTVYVDVARSEMARVESPQFAIRPSRLTKKEDSTPFSRGGFSLYRLPTTNGVIDNFTHLQGALWCF